MRGDRHTPSRSCRAGGVLLLIFLAAPALAQEQRPRSRTPLERDVATLDGILHAFYDVISGPRGQPRDWARDSTLYLPGVRFIIGGRSADGTWRARIVDHHTYAVQSAGLENGFFEEEIHRVTRTFGPMVHVFSTYAWRTAADGPTGGRGINSIELFNDGTRWWIASAMWVGEDADNPIPAEFLPRPGGVGGER